MAGWCEGGRLWTLVLGLAALAGGGAARAAEVVFARHLALAPDGTQLAFRWAGDVWTVSSTGGTARRLTAHPAFDGHPVWSRDGAWLAFSSDRHGSADVFVMRADGTDVRRLTFTDQDEVPSDFSADGAWVYFHSQREGDVYREPRVYRVARDGGQPWRALECFAHDARVGPEGERIAFVRGRTPWWRRGYRGAANFDVYLHDARTDAFTQITDFDGTDRLPWWAAGGDGLYFLSDRGGTMNVWYQPLLAGEAQAITRMTGDDVRDMAVSADGGTLAFTHGEDVYVLSLPDGPARQIDIVAGEDYAETDVRLETLTSGADEAEPSPDGEEIALVVHGEIQVIKTKQGRWTRRVTESPARDRHVVWSPDGKALFFVSDRDGQEDIYRAISGEEPPAALSDSLRFRIQRVTDSPELEYDPQVSPDGKTLAFLRKRGDLVLRDLKTGAERVRVESWNAPRYRWSPDSKWIAYEIEDVEHNPDVWIVPAEGSAAPVNISQHPDYDGNPQWSADGQILAFASRRHGFDADLYLVFLSRALDEKSAVDLEVYFEAASEKVKKRKPLKKAVASGDIALAGQPAPAERIGETQPATQPTTQPAADLIAEARARLRAWLKALLEEEDKPAKKDAPEEKDAAWELATAHERVRRVTALDGDQGQFALSPDGRLLAFTSAHEGEPKLFTIEWNSAELKRIASAPAEALRWGLEGKRLFFLRDGVPRSCAATGGSDETHGFRAKMMISRAESAAQKFNDGARQLGLRFYHPTLKGLDWSTLTEKYKSLALEVRTIIEFNEVFDMLLGELNASHLGIYGPARGQREPVGYLGVRVDPAYAGPGLKVLAVVPRAPADRAECRLVPGDVLLTVDGRPVGPEAPLERALVHTVGDEIIVEYLPSPARPAAGPDATPAATQAASAPPASAPAGATPTTAPVPRAVVMRPISYGQLNDLAYDAWVEENRRYVEARSDGRVGYVHIRAMGTEAFEVFERDLYAAAHDKDGLIIDVRNNGGGWTADWVLAVLSVRRHAYTVPRGGVPGYPQDRLIFYSWVKPATMVCNQHSFSNAEIISHAFKNLGRGPLVGTTTAGGVISTGAYRLIDGALVRMPFRGWYTLPGGFDMEERGAVPDIEVPVTPADEAAGRKPQLDAAIAATLEQIEAFEPNPAVR